MLYATWIDQQKAFDKVWTDGLLVKCKGSDMWYRRKDIQVGILVLTYIKARVTVDGKESRKFLLRHGVPHGGVISPTLFLIFIVIDDLIKSRNFQRILR